MDENKNSVTDARDKLLKLQAKWVENVMHKYHMAEKPAGYDEALAVVNEAEKAERDAKPVA